MAGLVGSASARATGPIITRFAGTGTFGTVTPNMQATSTNLGVVGEVALDSAGNVYIGDENNFAVEKVTHDGNLTLIAGTGGYGVPVPGPATSSPLGQFGGLAVDGAGNVYIADRSHYEILKVTPGGTLSIVAGTGTQGAPTPGPALSSHFSTLNGLAVDSAGDLYVGDSGNHEIEKVSTGGTLSIIAGTGLPGTPTSGPAVDSALGVPIGVAVDGSGNVYIADGGDNLVEKIASDGTLSIFAGDGSIGPPTAGPATSSPLSFPYGIATDSRGDVFISTLINDMVDEVTPAGTLSVIAGDLSFATPTYGGPPTSSGFKNPYAVAVDSAGTVFVADGINFTVDRIGETTPGAPGLPVLTPRDGQAGITFSPPVDWGTSPLTGYEYSLDGGSSWQTLTTSAAGGNLIGTIGSLTDGTPYPVIVRADNGSGPGAPSQSVTVIPEAAPANLETPSISFTAPATAGTLLTATTGNWSGTDLTYSYQWTWAGSPISGATAGTYTPTAGDVGHLITVIVTATNSVGQQSASSGSVTVEPPAPANTFPPGVSGSPSIGSTLTCLLGSWTGGVVTYTYQWSRDGAPIAGGTGSTYTAASADAGHSLTCTVTAVNSTGQTSATSAPVLIPLTNLQQCPNPSGTISGIHIGPLWVGETRAHARQTLPRYTITYNGFDDFCLNAGFGIRAAYASPALLAKLTGGQRRAVRGRIVWALTANHYYSLDGIVPGSVLASIAGRSDLGRPFQIGVNTWYVIPGNAANGVLKVRDGQVYEVGLVSKRLTSTRTAQRIFLHAFPRTEQQALPDSVG